MIHLSDETLCRLAASGDRIAEEALVMRYTRLVRICARPYFLAGGDSEDLIQEGMVGLIKAMRDYDTEKEASFKTYAEICIRSRLISAVKAASRDKHTPLNESVSLETPLFDETFHRIPFGFIGRNQKNPEDLLIGREELQEVLCSLDGRLSGFESKVLSLYLSGLSYAEIAARINRPPKSVDNAVQRVRRKLAQRMDPSEISKG